MDRSRSELNARFIELRFAENGHLMDDNDPDNPEYYTFHLSLDRKPEELLKSFHNNCIRRAIRKANEEQFEIITGTTHQHLKTFYRLHLLTRKKHGVPIQPFKFFRNLWNALTPRDMLTLLLVRLNGSFVAGIILLWYKNTAYYKYGASDPNFLHLRANQWLMWKAIQLAQKRGCSTFDFGRASSSERGLVEYKSRWGTQNSPLDYLRMPMDQKSSLLKEESRQHIISKNLIRRMPKIGIRLVGEFFYRHFA